MATFGTPRSNGHEAEDALACARDILADIAALNERRETRGEPRVEVGIGVHFGPVVLGDVGDENRLEFAVVGDTVNVASRFERLTRELGVRLVVSGDLISALSEGAHKLVAGLDHGAPQRVRGRQEPVPVWTMPNARVASHLIECRKDVVFDRLTDAGCHLRLPDKGREHAEHVRCLEVGPISFSHSTSPSRRGTVGLTPLLRIR